MPPELIGGLTPEQIEILGSSFESGFFTIALFSVVGYTLGVLFDLIKRG
jgi:hypothetical protein